MNISGFTAQDHTMHGRCVVHNMNAVDILLPQRLVSFANFRRLSGLYVALN